MENGDVPDVTSYDIHHEEDITNELNGSTPNEQTVQGAENRAYDHFQANQNGLRRATSFSRNGSTVSFRDIRYSVMVSAGKCCGRKTEKHILKGIK